MGLVLVLQTTKLTKTHLKSTLTRIQLPLDVSLCLTYACDDLIITISKRHNYKQLQLYLFIQDDSTGSAFFFTQQYLLLYTAGYVCKYLIKT